MTTKLSLEQKIAALGDLSRAELVDLWIRSYGHAPPSGIRQPLLIRAAAWHLQQKHLGGYSAATRQLLNAAIKRVTSARVRENDKRADPSMGDRQTSSGAASETSAPTTVERSLKPRRTLVPGMRLLRDWNGRRHAIDVTDQGFVYDGVCYRSLSAIARRITGAHWSGPRFFGL